MAEGHDNATIAKSLVVTERAVHDRRVRFRQAASPAALIDRREANP